MDIVAHSSTDTVPDDVRSEFQSSLVREGDRYAASLLARVKEYDQRALGQPQILNVADMYVASMESAVTYAFMEGRKALGKDLDADRAAAAVRKALLAVLPGTLLSILVAGGNAGFDGMASKLRATSEQNWGRSSTRHPAPLDEVELKAFEAAESYRQINPKGGERGAYATQISTLFVLGAPKRAIEKVRAERDLVLNQRRDLASDPWDFEVKFDQFNPFAVQWASEHALELADGLSATSKSAIKEALGRLLTQGDRDLWYQNVLDAVGDAARAKMIAHHEPMLAANEGQRQAWDQAVKKGWLSPEQKRVWIGTPTEMCPVCQALDGKTAKLDGSYPSDGGDGPPQHVGCRCTEGLA